MPFQSFLHGPKNNVSSMLFCFVVQWALFAWFGENRTPLHLHSGITYAARSPSCDVGGTPLMPAADFVNRTGAEQVVVIQHMMHDEQAATIGAEEAEMIVATQHAGFIERPLGVGVGESALPMEMHFGTRGA